MVNVIGYCHVIVIIKGNVKVTVIGYCNGYCNVIVIKKVTSL
jgi:hypothetical protein